MLRGKLFAAQHQSKDAEIAFERAVQLDPGSAEVHAEYGAFRLRRREYDKAQKQLDASLQVDASNPRVLADAARAYLGINRIVEADKRVQEALAKDPSHPAVLVAWKVEPTVSTPLIVRISSPGEPKVPGGVSRAPPARPAPSVLPSPI